MSSFRYCSRGRAATSRRAALTLIEVVVIILIVGFVFVLLGTCLTRTGSRPLTSRLVCAANLKGIGTSMKLYANDNFETWPVPAFDETAIGDIWYTVPAGGGAGTAASPNRRQPSLGGAGGARELSTTRAMWMMVRSGDVTVKQFACPASKDAPDPTEDIDLYYDFAGIGNVSYGYQVPFGPLTTRAREGMYSRVPLAADRGPYRDAKVALPPTTYDTLKNPKDWRPFNSPNHRGEGQIVLYADGHVTFERTPIVGIDKDNIYTVSLDNAGEASRVIGESPWARSAHPFQPVDADGKLLSSTDTVIYP